MSRSVGLAFANGWFRPSMLTEMKRALRSPFVQGVPDAVSTFWFLGIGVLQHRVLSQVAWPLLL